MKKTYIVTFALAALMGGSSCDSNWLGTEIPQAVKEKFAALYPTVKHVDWDHEAGLYEAEFEISNRERVLLFEENGSLVSQAEEIEERYLPAAALEKLQQQYAGYQVDEVHRVKENGHISFRVELEDQLKEVQVHFDTTGALLKQQEASSPAKQSHQSASLLPVAGIGAAAANTLGKPVAEWELPAELKEVSGIAWLPDGKIACVQDEQGTIFIFDLEQKKVVDEIQFAGPGDYEGIAVVGKTAYVMRSDGTLFELADFRNGNAKPQEYRSTLSSKLNMEGLTYDEANNRLLLASKGHDSKLGDFKGLYAFSLGDKKLQASPVMTIPLAHEQLTQTSKKKKNKQDILQPSSLEMHPKTGELYLTDAVNHRLLTIDEQGKIQKVASLDKKLLVQPEGLTFGPDGEVYIASEGGKKGNGKIVKYSKGI